MERMRPRRFTNDLNTSLCVAEQSSTNPPTRFSGYQILLFIWFSYLRVFSNIFDFLKNAASQWYSSAFLTLYTQFLMTTFQVSARREYPRCSSLLVICLYAQWSQFYLIVYIKVKDSIRKISSIYIHVEKLAQPSFLVPVCAGLIRKFSCFFSVTDQNGDGSNNIQSREYYPPFH